MPPVTFTPQSDFEVAASAFSALSDLANTARPAQQTGSPWMTHTPNCACLLCR